MVAKRQSFKERLYQIVFEAETTVGKLFDLVLILSIFMSVGIVMLDSVESVSAQYGSLFYTLEWIFTGLFTLEYLIRLWVIPRPIKYATSFFGVIDVLAILPAYLSLIFSGTHVLLVIRLLRVLRIFRILKLVQFVSESRVLLEGLKESARKIFVFIFSVFVLVVILGALIYSIEGGENGFSSIPKSVYWAIVTLTTVGYGDIAPTTNGGQLLAAIIMLLGYGIIAVPAGIVTSQLTMQNMNAVSTEVCPNCAKEGHEPDATYCKFCGGAL